MAARKSKKQQMAAVLAMLEVPAKAEVVEISWAPIMMMLVPSVPSGGDGHTDTNDGDGGMGYCSGDDGDDIGTFNCGDRSTGDGG